MLDSDEARNLVFDIGVTLGFSPKSCDTLIGITGNPISALKFLVVVGKEGRKMATLQKEGKLQLPPPASEEIDLKPSGSFRKRMKGEVQVVRTRTRRTPRKNEDK